MDNQINQEYLIAQDEISSPSTINQLDYTHIYNELRVIAHSHRRRWNGNDTLNTTAIIHEAYLKMANGNSHYKNRKHFLSTASKAMRQVLVNYAERSNAEKRQLRESVDDVQSINHINQSTLEELLYIDQLLKKIEDNNQRHCKIVECRIFGGMNIHETAEVLGISISTVKREWNIVSAWLFSELNQKVKCILN